jgi:hypothetical protein
MSDDDTLSETNWCEQVGPVQICDVTFRNKNEKVKVHPIQEGGSFLANLGSVLTQYN